MMDRSTANRVARNTKHGKTTAYKCPHCGNWHVGKARPIHRSSQKHKRNQWSMA